MPKSQNSRTGLAYVVESTFGTTPATPTLVSLPFATHDLNLEYDTLNGTDIEPDEMERHLRLGNRRVTGSIVGDLRKGDYDTLLESVMRNTWAANVLKIGTTPKYMTFEDSATDIGNFLQYKGSLVNSLSLSITGGASTPVQATFGIMGRDRTTSSSTVASSLTAASGNSPFDHHSGSLAIGNVGASSAMCVTSISMELSRNIEGAYCVGDPLINEMISGRSSLTGSFTAYYMDDSLIGRLQNETLTEIEVQVDDETGSNPYTFLLPSVKLTAAPVPVSAATGPRMIEVPFTALFDDTEDTTLKITRTA